MTYDVVFYNQKEGRKPNRKEVKIMKTMKKYYCYNCYGVWIGNRTLEQIEKWNAQPRPVSEKIKYWDEV